MLDRIDRRVAVALVGILAVLSIQRTYVWMSEERLWREAVASAPQQAEPKIQLAKYVRAAEALELLGRARQESPYNPEIPAETGKILLDEQQYQSAVEELSRAVAMNPNYALAFNNRGVALAALGQSPTAAADFQQALRLDPQLQEARENLKRLTGK
jgi:Flp pilus assembly protein TadD